MKSFKKKIKEVTRRTLTLNKEEWLDRVNPIIRGKTNKPRKGKQGINDI
ncbi:MAG: group II intron maturase-specific domain-containing protein [Clostridia bacterium]